MRIAMFSDYFHPELGGIQDSVAITARALGDRGHRLDLHVPRYGSGDYTRIDIKPGESDLGANVAIHRHVAFHAPSTTQQSRVVVPSFLRTLHHLRRNRPDVIHLHSFLGLGIEAILAGAALNIPVVGTNHTAIAAFTPYLPVKPDWAIRYVAWFHNRCDMVTAPSRSVLDDMGPDWLQRPHQIISNPIDTTMFHPAHAIERAKLKVSFGLPDAVVTYAGRLGPEKNIDVVLRAVTLLGDPHNNIVVAIAGHGSHEAALRELAAELGIADRVRFLGTLPKDRLADLMRATDVFAMMSTSETQSMTLLQAMACGVPVVAARARALPEFVTAENGILVAPDDAEDLARQLGHLFGSETTRTTLGAGGPPSVQHYGIEGVTDRWEMLYRDLTQKVQPHE